MEGGPTLSPVLWWRSRKASSPCMKPPLRLGWEGRGLPTLVSWVTESLAVPFSVLSVRVHSDMELATAGCRVRGVQTGEGSGVPLADGGPTHTCRNLSGSREPWLFVPLVVPDRG